MQMYYVMIYIILTSLACSPIKSQTYVAANMSTTLDKSISTTTLDMNISTDAVDQLLPMIKRRMNQFTWSSLNTLSVIYGDKVNSDINQLCI